MGATWVEPLRNASSDSDNLFGETSLTLTRTLTLTQANPNPNPYPNPNPGEASPDPLHGRPASGPARVKFGTPHWVDFGQELAHSPDGKAYLVAHGSTSPDTTEMWMLGDQVYLARVLPTVASIDDRAQW